MSTFLFLLALVCLTYGFKLKDSERLDKNKLQVHLVPHTHDDVGWLKTVDEYYYGSNNSIQHAGVQYILDSVIPQLSADPSKRFIYVEIAFFERWWNEQSEAMRAEVKKLVQGKRLEFINAGWCMNDEAATHYNAIIDQMTYGLNFVEETFGSDARPRIAWHIDPFGHSSEQASIFAQMSFDGFFFGRIDYADKILRLEQQRMELVWRGSTNLGQDSDIFAGVLYNNYAAPRGFCYDQSCKDAIPIQDDPNLFDYNVDDTVERFVKAANDQAAHYKTNHILMTMGEDFQYENANTWYKNMDKLIKYVNKDGRVNAFYSTPTLYLDALHSANQTWELKTDDFFPYADCPDCYWTGYFTSRPALKRYVRYNNNLLQVCKQLELINGSGNGKTDPTSDTLRRAMGVAQHHDAVSGTSKQHVADDYAKRLAIGASECQVLIADVLGKFTLKSMGTKPPALTFCDHLNISVCHVTEQSKAFTVTVYNPIARDVTAVVRLPIASSTMAVYGPHGASVKSQILPISDATKQLRKDQNQQSSSSFEIVFNAKVPPLGFATYFINSTKSPRLKDLFQSPPKKVYEDADEMSIENEFIKLSFSSDTGHLTSMTDKSSKVTSALNQAFYWYNASIGNKESKQPSGAYIFRPNKSEPILISQGQKTDVYKGPLVQEVRQVISPFISQVIRLYTGQRHAEFEYTVGPIPIADKWGKEVIVRFDTDIKSSQLFYTDANGREMQERKFNYRPTWKLDNKEPVAGNYYPVNSRLYIKDADKQLTVLTDRSLGGASLKDGSMEIMLHRRLLVDDKRGVAEPLNESGILGKGLIVRGKLCLTLAPPQTSAALHRELGELMLLEPVLALAPNSLTFNKWTSQYNSLHSGLNRELPANVHLLTLETMGDLALIRVEHQYEAGEDAKLSQPVNISLEGLFTDFEIDSMTEMNLSANQLLQDKQPLHWNIKTGEKREKKKKMSRALTDLNVHLTPMEIRTFKAVIKRHSLKKSRYNKYLLHFDTGK